MKFLVRHLPSSSWCNFSLKISGTLLQKSLKQHQFSKVFSDTKRKITDQFICINHKTLCSRNFRIIHTTFELLAELSNCLHNFQIVHTTFDLLTQLSNCLDKILSKFQCGFWKGVGAQHCLFLMIEKWKKL